MEKICAGIDLGTTNSCIAVLEAGRPVVIANELGEPTTPSLVSVLADGSIVVGKKARSRLLTHPAETFASIKRRMGERYTRSVLGREYSPESVSALILAHLKNAAERHLGGPLDNVVITVPANFNSVQRQATRDAGEIAGFHVLRVLNEPTAAALAYGHQQQLTGVLVVFDLGGGTFDISVVEAGGGLYEVIHSAGDNHLGGDDFNMRIVTWIVREFEKQTGLDVRRDVQALSVVHEWAIAAKHALSKAPEVRVKIDRLFAGRSLDVVLTRRAFEEMCADLFNRLRAITWNVSEHLRQPKYLRDHPGVFDNQFEGCDILLVGGETRVPAVRQLVQTIFKGRVRTDVNPDEVVAMGAALQAGVIHQQGSVKEVILVDTTALPLGTAVSGGVFSRLIDANTRIPCSRTQEYAPEMDYQPTVVFEIYQGDSDLCAKNIKLGEFEVRLDPPRMRSLAVILLTFHLDADDILHVSAVDKETGAARHLTIKGSQNLDRDAVERLRREARTSRHEDEKEVRRLLRRAELRNRLQQYIWQLDAAARSGHPPEELQPVRDFAAQLHRALSGKDDDLLERSAQDLESAWQNLCGGLPQMEADPDPAIGQTPLAPPPAGRDEVNCANCGARLPPGFAFCGKCGVPLKKDNCSACGAALVEGFKFCGKCGARIE